MDWIGAKVDWIKKIRFFAHPYVLHCYGRICKMAREACANVWEERQQHYELAIVGYVYKFK